MMRLLILLVALLWASLLLISWSAPGEHAEVSLQPAPQSQPLHD